MRGVAEMEVCCVSGCGNHTGSCSAGISFHKFPTSTELRKQWVSAIGRGSDWAPSKWSSVCAVHFKPDDFDKRLLARSHLRSNAVPSIALPVQPTGAVKAVDGSEKQRLGSSDVVCLEGCVQVVVVNEPADASEQKPVEILEHKTGLSVSNCIQVKDEPADTSGQEPADLHTPSTDLSLPSTSMDLGLHSILPDAPELSASNQDEDTLSATEGKSFRTTGQHIDDTLDVDFLLSELARYRILQTASKKKIKGLQQSQRRLKEKVARMQDTINDLTRKNRDLRDQLL